MKLKLFEEFLFESRQGFTEQVLSALEPTLNQMVDKIKDSIQKEFEKKGITHNFTEWEIQMIRMGLIVDMLKSFQNYVQSTDDLVSILPRSGNKGIEIFAKIQRGADIYDYFTEAIYAGGYNIQKLHLRYLTKTNMPRIKSDLAKEYEQKYKNLNKVEKLNAEIQETEKRIADNEAKIKKGQSLTDEQIAKILREEGDWTHKQPTWQQIIKNGAAQNFNNSETEYLAKVKETEKYGIEHWKTQNIHWPQNTVKMLQKPLAKMKEKLSALLQNT